MGNKKRKFDDDDFIDEEPFTNPPETPRRQLVKATKTHSPRKPYYQDAQADKPKPVGEPEIWAEKRQQLCEALPFYNAYQSSAYTRGKIVLGMLIDAECCLRDKFTDQIIITSAGGGRVKGKSGDMVFETDQTTCRAAVAYKNSKQKAIGVIAGRGNKLSPSHLPHNYNFLAFFHVTDIWCEQVNGVAVCKVRLEKIDLEKQSWWAAAPQGSPEASLPRTSGSTRIETTPSKDSHSNVKLALNTLQAPTSPIPFKLAIKPPQPGTTPTTKLKLVNKSPQARKTPTKLKIVFKPKTTPPLPALVSPIDTRYARSHIEDVGLPQILQCPTCQKPSKEIFNAGWTCLEGACSEFFRFPRGNVPTDSELDYTPEFLAERTPFNGTIPELVNSILTEESRKGQYLLGYQAAKSGIVCPSCNCCIRRRLWNGWECENKKCGYILSAPHESTTIKDLLKRFENDTTKKTEPPEFFWKQIRKVESLHGAYNISAYSIPDGQGKVIGFVYHFKANKTINREKDGPDELFRDIQEMKLPLKRNPAKLEGKIGEILTAHYATNWGAPYKFAVKQESQPFSNAPDSILKTVKRLTWAGRHSVPKHEFRDFNELLAVGYAHNGHMGYHDDGEKGLGPTVASLSLGCPAVMKWRPKKKTDITGEPVGGRRKTKSDVLKIVLKHGDMMLMHGAGIQRLYEHAVEPLGDLRFVLTSRYIEPEMGVRHAGTFPDWFDYKYDGSGASSAAIPKKKATPASNKCKKAKADGKAL